MTHHIEVTADIHAPIAAVFDTLTTHERFFRGQNIQRCILTRTGETDKNGTGAIREVFSEGFHFVEEITRFERPTRYDYRIQSLTLHGRRFPMLHDSGIIELTENAGITHITWRSDFRVAIPLLGLVIGRVIVKKASATFKGLLQKAKEELETPGRL